MDYILSSGKKKARICPLCENTTNLRTLCGEKFTKCSLHSSGSGCIMVAIYWLSYATMITLSLVWRKQIDDMQ